MGHWQSLTQSTVMDLLHYCKTRTDGSLMDLVHPICPTASQFCIIHPCLAPLYCPS